MKSEAERKAMRKENVLIPFLKKFDQYPFCVKFRQEEYRIGDGEPKFTVSFKEHIALSDLMASTSLALGEAYMDGSLEIEGDLYDTLNHFLSQMNKFSTDKLALKKLLFSSRSKGNQKKEVQSHYDLGNDFYRLWLDETMSYSCGYFQEENTSLLQAQIDKVDYILKKLHLEEGMHLLDIGCGWGFLLTEAVRKYGVRGTGITLSQEQYEAFQDRIRKEGLERQLEVKLLDYRDLPECGRQFDRVVSVGMVEHVGRGNYEEFLDCVKSVLKPGGLFLLHFISALTEHPGDAWIKKYIFPGGVIPSLREILYLAGDRRFYTIGVESLRRHYNRTLLCWNRNFQERREEVVNMFDERFARMWELYLCACAATFMNGIIDLHQILFTNGGNNELPLTKWY